MKDLPGFPGMFKHPAPHRFGIQLDRSNPSPHRYGIQLDRSNPPPFRFGIQLDRLRAKSNRSR